MNPISCKFCGGTLKITLTPESIHYGKLNCEKCLKFNGWARNPESPNFDSKRIGNHADIDKVKAYHEMKEAVCFMCIRKKEQLGAHETLTIDHIIELDKGGQDEVFNMQILCTACHKLKNWLRLYTHWHLNGKQPNPDDDSPTTPN